MNKLLTTSAAEVNSVDDLESAKENKLSIVGVFESLGGDMNEAFMERAFLICDAINLNNSFHGH